MSNWWKEAVVYQIYPRSFADSDGDGIGDLNGITSKLDYLKMLGVDVIWLCPVYKSPDSDNGYDISSYTEISEKFGMMKDFDRLLDGVHRRGMKLIMDGVFNHTSDEHRWFTESKKSKTSRYRDYYFWKKGRNGREPNNWESRFGGSAWEYDRLSGEYYLHIWGRKQPDLNWDNKKVRMEIYRIMRWWLDKGVDGFRLDVINFISKAPGLPDASTDGRRYADGSRYYVNGPKVDAYLKEMNMEVLSRYDTMSVGELLANLRDLKIVKRYVCSNRHELNMAFHENNEIESGKALQKSATLLERRYNKLKWNLTDLKNNFTIWQEGLEGDCWDSVYLGNHDNPRIVSRFGDDGKYRIESAKMLATLIFTLRGTPYVYQGDEIGMTDPKFSSIKDYRDIAALQMYSEYKRRYGSGERAIKLLKKVSRDNARTPMQWNGGRNAGFTKGTPWIRLGGNYRRINVERDFGGKESIFRYYKNLIALRKRHRALIHGRYEIMLKSHKRIYAYTRKLEEEWILVVLNFSKKNATFILPKSIQYSKASFLLGNYSNIRNDVRRTALRPYEAMIYKLE